MQNQEPISQHTARKILNRDFVLGFFALFAFLVACYSLVPTLPIYLSRLGSGERAIGELIGIYSAAALIFRFLVGGVLHKYSERAVMMFGSILFAVTFLALILFRPFWPFFAVRFSQGIAYACLDTAVLAFIVNAIPLRFRVQGLAYFFLAPTFALAIAPSFGMLLLNRHNATLLFSACLGLSLCAFSSSYGLRAQNVLPSQKDNTGNGRLLIDFKIIAPTMIGFLQCFVMGAIYTFLPLYAVQCGVRNPGHFFSSIAAVVIAGRILAGRIVDTWSKGTITIMCISVSTLAMVILYFSRTLPMFVLAGLIWGVGATFIFSANMAYAFDYSGSSGGTSVGTYMALTDLGLAIGPMVMGAVIPLIGYSMMFLSLGFVCVVNLCYFQFYLEKKCGATSSILRS
ncbi:MAG TPA: MFS transporter [Syntrophorhabdaceae bacterium]|nr:MFS transporter [Syntrophorhabdaceae bacterium]